MLHSSHPETSAPSISEINRRYIEEWRNAPKAWQEKAEAMGLKPHIDGESDAIEYDPGFTTASFTPDIAENIDSEKDRLTEKYGWQHEVIIHAIVDELGESVRREKEANSMQIVKLILGQLIGSDGMKLKARIHAFAWAIPGFAMVNNLGSMRESGRQCGVSVEWIRKLRAAYCDLMGIPIPEEARKTPEACEKYKQAALTNHPTKQIFGSPKPTTPHHTTCTTIPPQAQTPKPPSMLHGKPATASSS